MKTQQPTAPRVLRATPIEQGPELDEFGSNQDAIAAMLAAQAPVAAPVQAPGPAPGPATAPVEPRRLDRTAVTRALGRGSDGDQVKALQTFLGLEGKAVDGDYGGGTATKVAEWQKANGLPETGRVNDRTVAAMRGDAYLYGYSWNHDPSKFVPKYPMTAYHESGVYRRQSDPYAVGAIARPKKEDDPGGKTYGSYQFESYTYNDGTNAGAKSVAGSTVGRFSSWKDNPYGKQFKEVIDKHGIGSAEFDALWTRLSTEDNLAFGRAQESFLELDKADEVAAMFDRMGASQDVRKDSRLVDLLMGTTNHIGNLAKGVGDRVKAAQDARKTPFTADELGRAIIDDKKASVNGHFSSASQDTRNSITARYDAERTQFPEKKK